MQFSIFGPTSWKRLEIVQPLAHDARKDQRQIDQSDSIAEDWYGSAQHRLVLEPSDWYDEFLLFDHSVNTVNSPNSSIFVPCSKPQNQDTKRNHRLRRHRIPCQS